MREKKILMLIMAIMLLLSNFTAFAGNPNPIVEGTEFTGNIDEVLSEGSYWVKDEPPHDGTLPLGNGYAITLDYNDCNTNVTWSLNDPADPDFEIRIKVIYVKASDAYVEYPDGLDDGSHILWSVAKECKDEGVTEDGIEIGIECDDGCEVDCNEGCGFHQVSHVTIVYEFTEIEKTGLLQVCKDVTNVDGDKTPFAFEVWQKDVLVTSGAVVEGERNCVSIKLPYGTYYLEETVPAGYKGTVTTGTVVLDGQNPSDHMIFKNVKDLPPGPGILRVEKCIHGDLAKRTDEFLIRVKNLSGQTVTGGAVSVEQPLSFELPIGEYIVEETGYGEYTPWYLTVSAIVESDTTTTAIFHNDKYSEPPGPGTLIVEKYVHGDLSNQYDEFQIRVKNLAGETVTGGAVSEMQPLSFELPIGEYVVEETGYGEYTPHYLTVSAIVESEATTTVGFHNDYYSEPPGRGDVTVYKAFAEGTDTTTEPFNFRIYSDPSLTDSSIVVPTSTRYGDPEVITGMAIGTYYVDEMDYPDYIEPPVQQFDIVEGQMAHVILTNTAIYYPDPGHLIIRKDVYGNRSDEDDVFEFTVTRDIELFATHMPAVPMPETVYASETTEGSIYLMPGTYIVEETEYGNYDPDFTTKTVTIVEGQDTVVEFRNEYDRKTDTKRYRMTIDKEADENEVMVNDIITYTIVVENTGNQTLTDIHVTDPMVGLDEIIERLPSSGNDTVEFVVTYQAMEEGVLENTATAEDDRAGTVEDDETVIVNDKPPRDIPGLDIEKIISGTKTENFAPGDIVEFRLLVTNTGKTKLNAIKVEDTMAGYQHTIGFLNPGDSQELFVNLTIVDGMEDFDNIATAEVDDLFAQDFAPVNIVEIIEEEDSTPLDLPQAGVSPLFLFYGLAAIASGLGLTISKKR